MRTAGKAAAHRTGVGVMDGESKPAAVEEGAKHRSKWQGEEGCGGGGNNGNGSTGDEWTVNDQLVHLGMQTVSATNTSGFGANK